MRPRPINLTGLSIEAAIEIATRDFLRSGMAALLHIARELGRNGVSREGISAILERERVEFNAWRVKSLA